MAIAELIESSVVQIWKIIRPFHSPESLHQRLLRSAIDFARPRPRWRQKDLPHLKDKFPQLLKRPLGPI